MIKRNLIFSEQPRRPIAALQILLFLSKTINRFIKEKYIVRQNFYLSINFQRRDDLFPWTLLFIVVDDSTCVRLFSFSFFLPRSLLLSLSPYRSVSLLARCRHNRFQNTTTHGLRAVACCTFLHHLFLIVLPFQSVPSLRRNRRPSTGTWSRRFSQLAPPSGDRQLSREAEQNCVFRGGVHDVPQGVKRPCYVTPR